MPVFLLFLCGLFIVGRVRGWVPMGHYARSREGHVDARWRLRHRAVFNGWLWLFILVRVVLVVVMWVLWVYLSFFDVGGFVYFLGP